MLLALSSVFTVIISLVVGIPINNHQKRETMSTTMDMQSFKQMDGNMMELIKDDQNIQRIPSNIWIPPKLLPLGKCYSTSAHSIR